ncbi:hypothetical protein OG21DRAFT_247303 [Imleria badia]|nr:hypothetical protein OG21DRAFT_247303 [Imleria badia]
MESVRGAKEELYWEKIPNKVQRWAVDKATSQVAPSGLIACQVSLHIPVIAVITELEKQCDESNVVSSMKEWCSSNVAAFGMTFACLTPVPDDCHPKISGRRAECQHLARNFCIDHALSFSAFGSMCMANALSSPSLKLSCNIIVIDETDAETSIWWSAQTVLSRQAT